MDDFSSNFERKNLFSTVIQQCSAKPINVEDPFDLALQTVFTTCDSFQRVIWKRLPTNNNYSHWNKCFFLFGTNISLNLSIEMKIFSRTQLFSNYIILKTSKKLFKRKRLFKKKIVENLTMLTFFIECWCIVPRNFRYFRHMNGSESLWLRSRKLDSILKGVTCSAFLSIVCSRSRWWLWDNWEWPGQHSQFLRCLIIPN